MQALRRALLRWFAREQRDLPWRRTRDPYAIWVSEVMLQQTQVTRVTERWPRFLRRFPTVRALALAPLDDVLAEWSGMGYYARARNLHRAAQTIAEVHGGVLPRTAAGLRELPGFGPYTAGAVASIAFDEATPLVDGNVARVLSRLFAVDGLPGTPSRERRLWALAAALVEGPQPGALNQSLMELGALVCTPSAPRCGHCPARGQCDAHRLRRVDELPPPKPRKAPRRLRLLTLAFAHRGALAFTQNRADALFGGLWSLPSYELKSAETPTAEAARRFDSARWRWVDTVHRTLTHRELSLEIVTAPLPPGGIASLGNVRWLREEALGQVGISNAMREAARRAYQDLRAPTARRRTARRSLP